jgi:hypothetical protein
MIETYEISNSGRATITKDPDAVLDYSWDWTDWLADVADTIASHEITVSGVTLNSSSNDGQIVTAVLSGGTLGQTAQAQCRITTASSPARIEDRTIFLKIRAR